MAYVPDANDPFSGGEKAPSLSWDGLPIGSTFTLTILGEAKLLQASVYGQKTLKFWDEEKTKPVMCAVTNVTVTAGPHSVGEDRSIWAQIPSNMFIALKDAQKTAGCKFLPGGTLHVKLVGETPHERKGYNPIKQYAAKYTPPVATQQSDPFDEVERPSQPTTSPVSQQSFARPATATAGSSKKPGW